MALIISIAVVIAFVILLNLIKFSLKVAVFVTFAVVLGATIWICTAKPDMHKMFSLNVIEYLMKINKDGSVTTTKQVTQTVVDKK